MRHHSSVLHELLKHIPWSAFDDLVDEYRADLGVRSLTTRAQLLALLYGQLAGVVSLRELETALTSHQAVLHPLGGATIPRSTLADANRSRPWQVFHGLFKLISARASGGFKRKLGQVVRLIDATPLRMISQSGDWTRFSANVCGAKAHIVYDPDADMPLYVEVTAAKIHDITAAKAMPIEPGATYVFDMGYYDFAWWQLLNAQGCRIVSRLKKNTSLALVRELSLPEGSGLLYDRIGHLPERMAASRRNPFQDPIREIGVRLDTGRDLRIFTNDLDAPAQEIADLYKRRWAIELFFRWIKQTLKISHFLGCSENAVRIQIAVALIAFLVLRLAQAAVQVLASPLAFARLIRTNLTHQRPISQLLKPFKPPKTQRPNSTQMAFTFKAT